MRRSLHALAPLLPALVLLLLLPARAARAGTPPSPGARPTGGVVPRYGDPLSAAARTPLARRVEELVVGLGREAVARGGAAAALAAPAVDARLEAALDQIIARLPASGPPGGQLTEQALALVGIVEPVPYLLTMLVPAGADDDVEVQLRRVLPPVLAQGRYRRVAASTTPLAGGGSRLALALQESFVELGPIARALPAGARVTVAGRVLPPYGSPALFVTGPDGRVTHLELSGRREPRGSFSGTFVCGPRTGAWQVEVAGEDRFGDAVLANFPVYCGVPAPVELAAPERAAPPVPVGREVPVERLRDEVEARVLELLRRDRAAAGAPPLTLDPRLTAVARGHSVEMRDAHFFGHISPTTGSALDRLTRAAVPVVRVRENLGRASSAEELDRGLMNSPSHRANMLAADVERVGIGVAVGARDEASGTYDLFLTQLFARVPEPFDGPRLESALRQRVGAARRDARAPAVAVDPALDQVARAVAAALSSARGGKPGAKGAADDPLDRALPELGNRYLWVRKVSAQALDVSQLGATPALVDRSATHAGFGVAAGQPEPDGSTPIWLVVLLAARR